MKVSKLLIAMSAAVAGMFGGAAQAAGTLTNVDGVQSPFGGFEWKANGAAWTEGIVAAEAACAPDAFGFCTGANSFVLRYTAIALDLVDQSKNPVTTNRPNLDADPDGNKTKGVNSYEYTIFAEITVKLNMFITTPLGCGIPPCVVLAQYETTGGTFDIFYDTDATAKVTTGAWTGFVDGTSIINGTIDAGALNTFSEFGGSSGFDVSGTVTNQSALVAPALLGTSFNSSLTFAQLASLPPSPGTPGSNFQTPSSVDTYNIETDPTKEDIFAVDGSQIFFYKTPEPLSLFLVGGALLAAGGVSRRKLGSKT